MSELFWLFSGIRFLGADFRFEGFSAFPAEEDEGIFVTTVADIDSVDYRESKLLPSWVMSGSTVMSVVS